MSTPFAKDGIRDGRPEQPLRILVLNDKLHFSGGRRLLFDYAQHLGQRGHRIEIMTPAGRGSPIEGVATTIVRTFRRDLLTQADLLVASAPKLVETAVDLGCKNVVHFCQGFPVADLEQRLNEGVVPGRFQRKGLIASIRLWWKRRTWRKRLEQLDRIYRMPAHLVSISPHLKHLLEKRYQRPVHLCRNGIRQEHFFPPASSYDGPFHAGRPCRVACIGSLEVTCKGIDDTLAAVAMAKVRGLPIRFLRVSATPFSAAERSHPAIDEFHTNLKPRDVGDLLRSCDAYISNSLVAEGFGLPAMEALSCGLPSILSDIPSYRSFSDRTDFCLFVPQRNSAATAAALAEVVNGTLPQRLALRHAALEVASDFSFDRACMRFADVVEQIACA